MIRCDSGRHYETYRGKTLTIAVGCVCFAQFAFAQETRLLFTSLSPAGSPNSVFFNAWAQRVNEQSQGTLKIDVRDGATLANLATATTGPWTMWFRSAGRSMLSSLVNFRSREVTNLPFMSDNNVDCSAALWRLFKSGIMDAEYKDAVPIWFGCLGQTGLHFSKSPRSTDDLGGLKLRVAGKVPSQLVQQRWAARRSRSEPRACMRVCSAGRSMVPSPRGLHLSRNKLDEVAFYHLGYPSARLQACSSCREKI